MHQQKLISLLPWHAELKRWRWKKNNGWRGFVYWYARHRWWNNAPYLPPDVTALERLVQSKGMLCTLAAWYMVYIMSYSKQSTFLTLAIRKSFCFHHIFYSIPQFLPPSFPSVRFPSEFVPTIHLNLSRPRLRLGLSKRQRCQPLHNNTMGSGTY